MSSPHAGGIHPRRDPHAYDLPSLPPDIPVTEVEPPGSPQPGEQRARFLDEPGPSRAASFSSPTAASAVPFSSPTAASAAPSGRSAAAHLTLPSPAVAVKRLRLPDGRYVARPPAPHYPLSFARGHLIGRLGGRQTQPYYLVPNPVSAGGEIATGPRHGDTVDLGPLLPLMDRLVRAGEDNSAPYLWDPFDNDIKESIGLLLDSIGAVLEDRACEFPDRPEFRLKGRECFIRPVLDSSDPRHAVPVCMCVDPAKVATAKHFRMEPGKGYVRVDLGRVGRLVPVKERAHRIVLWAIYGPPPEGIRRNLVVMHMCNNPACLNPEHLIWGDKQLNATKGKEAALAHAFHQLKLQRGICNLDEWMARLKVIM